MSNRCRALARGFVFLAVFTLVALPLAAQTVTGTMRGTVTDRSGAALPGVTVTIKNIDTGLERVFVTARDGTFNAPFLPIGRYNVQAELAGFGTMKHQNVGVELNQTVVQEFVLDPALQETVTVSADAPRIDVTDGEVKQTMRSKEIMNLPSPDQTNFLRLASTFSGYQENPTSGQDNPTASSGSSINFNGAGTRGASFQINGVNNDDSSENQQRQNVPLATIQTFQVLSNSFSAEFGRGYGAVVLVQTKQGTNSIDGELYGYGQDNKYIARDKLQASLSHGTHFRRQFGATAGFPIIRDTLFGFVNTDTVQNQGTLTATRALFLPADASLPRLTLGNDTPANRAWQDAIMARWPKGATPNAPKLGVRAYQYPQDTNWPDRDASARLDYNLSLNNTVTARYQRDHQIRSNSEQIIGEQTQQNNRQSNFGLTWTNILSSNTVQEGRIGIGLRSTNVNIMDGNDTPIVRINDTVAGYSFTILGNAGNFPINRRQRDNQFVYNLTSSHFTSHTLKVGADIRQSQLNDVADNYSRGFWTFSELCGGVHYGTGLAAFMAGCAAQYWHGYGPFALKNKIPEQNVYAQDDWRPSDNLTFNLGARYEHVNAPKEVNNLVDYQYKSSSYIDPRLGVAYTPDWDRNRFWRAVTGGNGKFSIRGGFGIYHGRVFQSVFSQGGANVRFNPPNALFLQVFDQTNVVDPTNGFVFVPGAPITQRYTITTIDPHLKMPETRQWNLTFERQAFWNSRFRVSYIGTFGKDLLQYEPWNLPVAPAPPGTAGAAWVVAQDWQCAGTGQPGAAKTAACPNAVPIAANEVSLRFPRYNERRPDARYGTNLRVTNNAASWYHGGQIEWETGEYHGFGGRMTYTLSKAIDTGSESTFVGTGDVNIFPLNDHYKRGLSRFDTRHRFTAVASYAFPWLRNREGFVGSAFGGWTLSTAIRLSSGSPFTIVDTGTPDIDFDSLANQRPVCVDPNYCGGWHISSPAKGSIPRSAFRHGVYGDTLDDLMGRNTYYADGAESVDAGLYKSFRLPYNTSFMLRLDVFNVFNHTTWWYPNNNFNSPTFGAYNATNYTPRTVQLGVRLLY